MHHNVQYKPRSNVCPLSRVYKKLEYIPSTTSVTTISLEAKTRASYYNFIKSNKMLDLNYYTTCIQQYHIIWTSYDVSLEEL